jgi:hypothetical protein
MVVVGSTTNVACTKAYTLSRLSATPFTGKVDCASPETVSIPVKSNSKKGFIIVKN